MCQCLERILVHGKDIDEDDRCRSRDDEKILSDFLERECLPELPQQHKAVEVEVDTEQEHEDARYPLNVRRIAHEAVVLHAEASRAGRTERKCQGIEDRHASEHEEYDFDECQAEINEVEDLRGILDLGKDLADGRPRRFGTHQVDVGAARHRDYRKKEYENAHASDPVCERSPEEDRMRE